MGKEYSKVETLTYKLIFLIGIISLLGDVIYEGARSVNGPFLEILGCSAFTIGLIVGISELAGYAFRVVSGSLSDRTQNYWLFTIFGYAMLIVVPLMFFADVWYIAGVFIFLERLGKAIRSPAKDTITSNISKNIGTGLGFAIVEIIDQFGAVLGPIVFVGVFFLSNQQNSIQDYHNGYLSMLVPYLILLAVLFITYKTYKRGQNLLISKSIERVEDKLSKSFWIYTLFTVATTIGFVSFILVGYHIKTNKLLDDAYIPTFYAIAMIVDAISAGVIGKLYDNLKKNKQNEKAGLLLLILIPILTFISVFLVFSLNIALIITGVVFWGIIMGAHETIMKAGIADLTAINKRGTGYGIFNTGYGIASFLSASAIGFLYDVSYFAIIIFVMIMQIIAILLFYLLTKEIK